MSIKISTLLSKVDSISNKENATIIMDFYRYMQDKGSSENHQINNLKVIMDLTRFLGSEGLYNVCKKEQITSFLNTKIKKSQQDPDKRWITTWNHYLNRIKLFFRWLYNYHRYQQKYTQSELHASEQLLTEREWTTPDFVKIKQRPTKRLSPYIETEIWERDELLTIIKYESYVRNKAILTLMWDLDARPHEITLLKVKHIRLREKYGEGEIPHEAKTGAGPILLTCSFPYVRDWLNEYPFKNEPNARLVCNLRNGSPLKPKALWNIMEELRKRIMRLLQNGEVNDEERKNLEYLLKTKKWNPYCIRHSAITSDSDYLPDYALKKKVRWSMNSKQASRYIKTRMGNDLKQKILVQNGIISEQEVEKKPSVLVCPRCSLVNAIDNKYCSKCSYPLVPSAFDEIKEAENRKMQEMEQRYENNIKSMREEIMEDMKNQMAQLMSRLKPEIVKEGLV
jgi:integrase/recombinase XerD